jgi:hypothetical protein
MSDTWLIVFAEDPFYEPSNAAQTQALELFARLLPAADEVRSNTSPDVRFIDCGDNFENVSCPACGALLEIEWWQVQMEQDFDNGFRLRPLQLPCCGQVRGLHQLVYQWPQGFARFSMQARNPRIEGLSGADIQQLEAVIGGRVRTVWQHL